MNIKRFVVAGLVIAVGLAAAWPFRHVRSSAPQVLSVNHAEADATWSAPQDLTLQVNPQSGPSPVPELPAATGSAGTLTRPASFNAGVGTDPPLEALPAPPFLPMAYESLLVPVRSNSNPPRSREPLVHEPLLPSADERAETAREKPGPLWRKHRIVEGDTLTGLAQRYLGDASRAGEIHVANLDRLASPDIMPLGVTLLIPPRIDANKPVP